MDRNHSDKKGSIFKDENTEDWIIMMFRNTGTPTRQHDVNVKHLNMICGLLNSAFPTF